VAPLSALACPYACPLHGTLRPIRLPPMTKRFRWILVGLVIGLATGGIAYAVVVNPPNASDRYYACVSNVGVVKAGTVRLNAPPIRCPNALDQIHSWNAAGSTGPQGVAGTTGETGATGATGPAGSSSDTGNGFSTYRGTYALSFTNEGCGTWELRWKILVVTGDQPAQTLGSCAPLVQVNGNPFTPVTSTAAAQTNRALGVQAPAEWRTMFGFDGYATVTDWTSAPRGWGQAISTGAPVVLNNGQIIPPSVTFPSFNLATPGTTSQALRDQTWAPGQFDGFILLSSPWPAGSPVPTMASLMPPDPSELHQYQVYSVP